MYIHCAYIDVTCELKAVCLPIFRDKKGNDPPGAPELL